MYVFNPLNLITFNNNDLKVSYNIIGYVMGIFTFTIIMFLVEVLKKGS